MVGKRGGEMKNLAAVSACVLLVGGCSPGNAWRDTTGQSRGFDQMRADELDCLLAHRHQ
jgi:hypothetical protein